MIEPKMTTAMEVAVLVKCLPDIRQAADLIEHYALSVAAGARLEATQEAHDRIDLAMRRFMEAPLVTMTEYDATLRDVAEEMTR